MHIFRKAPSRTKAESFLKRLEQTLPLKMGHLFIKYFHEEPTKNGSKSRKLRWPLKAENIFSQFLSICTINGFCSFVVFFFLWVLVRTELMQRIELIIEMLDKNYCLKSLLENMVWTRNENILATAEITKALSPLFSLNMHDIMQISLYLKLKMDNLIFRSQVPQTHHMYDRTKMNSGSWGVLTCSHIWKLRYSKKDD